MLTYGVYGSTNMIGLIRMILKQQYGNLFYLIQMNIFLFPEMKLYLRVMKNIFKLLIYSKWVRLQSRLTVIILLLILIDMLWKIVFEFFVISLYLTRRFVIL